jgi:hypothetical protein
VEVDVGVSVAVEVRVGVRVGRLAIRRVWETIKIPAQ